MKRMISMMIAAMIAATSFAQSAAELAKQQAELNAIHRKMLNARDDGKYELESLIHNLIFPMGLTYFPNIRKNH